MSKKEEAAANVNPETSATAKAEKPVEAAKPETKAPETATVNDAVNAAIETGKSVNVNITSTTESAGTQFWKGLCWGSGVAIGLTVITVGAQLIFGKGNNE